MIRNGLIFLSFVCLILWFSSCKKDDELQKQMKIGVLLPLTGTGSSTGESCQVAMNLAKGDIQQYLHSVGLDEEVAFILEDSQTDPDAALQKINTLKELGCNVVIGPYSSAEVLAVKSYCDQNGMIVISPSSVAISLAIEGDNIYRMAPDDRNQARAMVELLKDDQKKNLVAVVRDDLWGNELISATAELFSAEGGNVDAVIHYAPGTVDFTSVVDQLSSALASSLGSYSDKESGVYLISFKEGTDILNVASQDSILNKIDWYGGSAYAENSTLPLDWGAAAFASAHHLACPIFGYDQGVADKWEPVVNRIKSVIGRGPEIYALAVYDAIWLTVLTYLSIDDREDLIKFKTAFEFECDNYIGTTGRTTLNTAGDRAFATYDFWGIRLFLNDFSWYRVATYNNATGELKRY